MSIILGISSLDCDACATFMQDGKIVYAAQEERFTRQKQQDGFPYFAIEDGMRFLGIDVSDISSVAYGWFDPETEKKLYLKSGSYAIKEYWQYRPSFIEILKSTLNIKRRARYTDYKIFKKYEIQLQKGLQDIHFKGKLHRFNHQLSHVASAYYTSGFDDSLVVSIDGYGSGSSGSFFIRVVPQ